MQKNKDIIVFTGGHAGSTTYATIECLKKKLDIEIHFIGGKSSVEGKKSRTLAQVGFSDLGVVVHNIVTGRLQTKLTLMTIPSIIKIPLGIIASFVILVKLKPKIVVSFGGYASFPVVFCSWLLRVPIIIHEQTGVAGRANQLGAIFAHKIALARESSVKYFPKNKCIVIGNPVPSNVTPTSEIKKMSSPPHMFITGGVSGSKVINETIKGCLPKLIQNFEVIHQVGDLDFKRFEKIKNVNRISDQKYRVYGTINPKDWGKILDWTDVFVARAGANFVYQLLIVKKPAVLIPLPFTYMNEQHLNALYAKQFGIAEVIEQKYLDPDILISTVMKLLINWPIKSKNILNKKSPDLGAAERFVDLILQFI